ncbi:MAG: hypothetical protein ABI402_18640 [Ferruginibacter sp.]
MNKRKIFFLVFIMLFIIFNCVAQHNKNTIIYLQEYGYTFTPQQSKCTDTIERKLLDGRSLRIVLFDCMGKMYIECYKGKRKIEEGGYIASLDLLKKYIFLMNGNTGKKDVRVREYFQPLRSGKWLFYDSHGHIKKKELYKTGILSE